MRRLIKWWRLWRNTGVTPWQFESDVRALRRLKKELIEKVEQ